MPKRKLLKPDESRVINDPCPGCGSLAHMRFISLTITLQCCSLECGLKVERRILSPRTQAYCEDACLKAWRRREIIPQPPAFKDLPRWAKFVAQDYNGQWHVYAQYPKLDCPSASWTNAAGTCHYTGVVGPRNPYWWKTIYPI